MIALIKIIHLLKVENQAIAYRIDFLYIMLRKKSSLHPLNICYTMLNILNAYNPLEKRDQ